MLTTKNTFYNISQERSFCTPMSPDFVICSQSKWKNKSFLISPYKMSATFLIES